MKRFNYFLLSTFLAIAGLGVTDQKGHDFYTQPQGFQIMNTSNYPQEIQRFLSSEDDAVLTHLKNGNYDSILEVGCATAIKAKLFVDAGYRYAGIDLNEGFINEGNAAILSSGLVGKASAHAISVYDLNAENNPLKGSQKTLVVFPFNLFGNLSQHNELIKVCQDLNFDIFISTFTTDQPAFEARSRYYNNCGFQGIRYEKSQETASFRSDDGLDTTAFSITYFESLLAPYVTSERVRVSTDSFDEIGLGILIQTIGTSNHF